jgi:hypothetical protein
MFKRSCRVVQDDEWLVACPSDPSSHNHHHPALERNSHISTASKSDISGTPAAIMCIFPVFGTQQQISNDPSASRPISIYQQLNVQKENTRKQI